MKIYITVVLAVLFLAPTLVMAETILVSAPLKGGDNGVVCSCINLTKNPIDVDFIIIRGTTSYSGNVQTISPGTTRHFWPNLITDPSVCHVIRDDGKSVSAKHLKCTFSAVDANGNPTAVIPVDTKFKQ